MLVWHRPGVHRTPAFGVLGWSALCCAGARPQTNLFLLDDEHRVILVEGGVETGHAPSHVLPFCLRTYNRCQASLVSRIYRSPAKYG